MFRRNQQTNLKSEPIATRILRKLHGTLQLIQSTVEGPSRTKRRRGEMSAMLDQADRARIGGRRRDRTRDSRERSECSTARVTCPPIVRNRNNVETMRKLIPVNEQKMMERNGRR
jgi:hypothetical protein